MCTLTVKEFPKCQISKFEIGKSIFRLGLVWTDWPGPGQTDQYIFKIVWIMDKVDSIKSITMHLMHIHYLWSERYICKRCFQPYLNKCFHHFQAHIQPGSNTQGCFRQPGKRSYSWLRIGHIPLPLERDKKENNIMIYS